MKAGDLVRVRYRETNDMNDTEWAQVYHGVIFETPDMGENCVWKMWCIERGMPHIISPRKDSIEVVSEVDIGD